jgi:hypothetical protein
MRCDNSEDREATPRNTVPLSSTNISEWVKMSVHITTSTLIQTQDMTIITDAKTYEIQMKRILPFRDIQGISSATVIDVTPLNSSSAQKVDICSWVSFNIWVNILKEDIQYTYLDTINYSFDDITTDITRIESSVQPFLMSEWEDCHTQSLKLSSKWKTVSWTVCWTQVFIWITLY